MAAGDGLRPFTLADLSRRCRYRNPNNGDRDTPAEVDNQPVIGERIRELRIKRGMTIKQLAIATGLHWQTVQRLETGWYEHSVTVRTLARVAAALNVDYVTEFREEGDW